MQSSKDKWVKNGLGHVLKRLDITDYQVVEISEEDFTNAQHLLSFAYRLKVIERETLNKIYYSLFKVRLNN